MVGNLQKISNMLLSISIFYMYNKQNNKWLLKDMEYLLCSAFNVIQCISQVSAAHSWDITLNTQRYFISMGAHVWPSINNLQQLISCNKEMTQHWLCAIAAFFRVGKKERKLHIQTSASVCYHTGHSLKLSRSFCHSYIESLYQNNHFQLKGKLPFTCIWR